METVAVEEERLEVVEGVSKAVEVVLDVVSFVSVETAMDVETTNDADSILWEEN